MHVRAIRLVVADDHVLIREGMVRILEARPGFEIVGAVADGDAAVELCRLHRPDVLILDISMPGPSIFEMLRQLREIAPQTRALILTGHPEERYALRCLEAGAAGYMTKGRPTDELLDAIHEVASGGRFVSAAAGSQLAARLRGEPAHQRLSPREFEVFLLLGRGLSVGEIASRLDISPKTVSTHRMHILEKLGLSNNLAIVRYVVDHELG